MKTKLDVTEECIAKGIKNDCNDCPVALAAKNIFPSRNLWVSHTFLGVSPDEKHRPISECMMATLPKTVQLFIEEFDRSTPKTRKQMCPFSFEVDLTPGLDWIKIWDRENYPTADKS